VESYIEKEISSLHQVYIPHQPAQCPQLHFSGIGTQATRSPSSRVIPPPSRRGDPARARSNARASRKNQK
jgi:hypothetical protein